MFMQRVATAAAALLIAGCSIHPLPEDVTGVPTQGIVKQIRCETRDAVRDIVLRYLDRIAPTDPIARELSLRFHANPEEMNTFDPKISFPGPKYIYKRDVFEVIFSAAIAYNFDLTMSEDNNLTAGVNLFGIGLNTFNLGITGDANRTRKNERTFTITDTLGYLLTKLNTPQDGERYCDGHIAVGPNYIYPIVGRIGVYNTVYTFFQLSIFDGLAGDVKKIAGDGKAPGIADVLTFTTTIDVMATPKITFAKITKGFQIADASVTGTAKRMDAHQVTLAVALDTKGTAPLTALRGYIFSGERSPGVAGTSAASRRAGGGQLLVLNRVTASTTNRAAQTAVALIDQLKSRELQLIPP